MAGHMQGFERIIHAIHGAHHGGSRNTYGGTVVPHQTGHRGAKSPELKNAQTLAKMFDSRSLDVDLMAFFFSREGDPTQVAGFQFIILLLNEWSDWYDRGEVNPEMGDIYYICRWAARALKQAKAEATKAKQDK